MISLAVKSCAIAWLQYRCIVPLRMLITKQVTKLAMGKPPPELCTIQYTNTTVAQNVCITNDHKTLEL